MKKLNKNGMTAIEVLICFSIVSIISVSMLKLVTSFKDKQEIESFKTSILTYKNTVTKAITSDIIAGKGVNDVDVSDITSDGNGYTISATIKLNNGLNGSLEITQSNKAYSSGTSNSSKVIYNGKDYPMPKIPNLQFNGSDIRISENKFLIIQVGFNHPDLGNQFDAIKIKLPLSSEYNNVY